MDKVFHIFRDLSCKLKLGGKAREPVSASLYVKVSLSVFDYGIGWYEIWSSEKDTHCAFEFNLIDSYLRGW